MIFAGITTTQSSQGSQDRFPKQWYPIIEVDTLPVLKIRLNKCQITKLPDLLQSPTNLSQEYNFFSTFYFIWRYWFKRKLKLTIVRLRVYCKHVIDDNIINIYGVQYKSICLSIKCHWSENIIYVTGI